MVLVYVILIGMALCLGFSVCGYMHICKLEKCTREALVEVEKDLNLLDRKIKKGE